MTQKLRLWWDYDSDTWREGQGFSQNGNWRDDLGAFKSKWLTRCSVCGVQQLTGVNRPCRCAECKTRHAALAVSLRGPAHAAVMAAVQLGQLPRLDGAVSCVDCGQPAHVYDHREYAKPLDVVPVCRSCNFRRGPAKEMAPHVRKRWNVGHSVRLRRASGAGTGSCE
jgi:hypothetical protein